MMKTVGVACRFAEDGSVQIQKIQLNGRWQPVGQGRQWLDETGRHVLIMLPGDEVRELLLQPDSLQWVLIEKKAAKQGAAV